MEEKGWACYCLLSPEGTTYVGSTVDIERRLRQHNREIVGGARATGRSHNWKRMCHVLGFPSGKMALQFEWAWKHISRKANGKTPLERRCDALVTLLNKEKATSNSLPFKDLEGQLWIYCEDALIFDLLKDKSMLYGIVLEI